jgi:dTDP-4-dehydrorhamnose 3,5-epimerase
VKTAELDLPGVVLIEPRVFGDSRGFFLETYQEARYRAAGLDAHWVQDNLSSSMAGVLRGLHFQDPHPQSKLVSVLVGRVRDVVVDLRPGSGTFGRHLVVELDGTSKKQLFIPRGFAHGFLTLEDGTLFSYKCDQPYAPESEHTLRWDDPELAIDWGVESPKVSEKDRRGRSFEEIRARLEGH